MKIEIDKKSGIPLYLQIKHQIKKLLERKRFIRKLAS
jgi:GntR family transcriptional regulator